MRGREAQSCFWDHVAKIWGPHSHCLKVTCAHCPLWAVPVMRGLGLAGHDQGWVCVQRSRPLGPHSPQDCWRDGCSSCLSARGCLHGQLVSRARPGRQRGKLACCATHSSPSCSMDLRGRNGAPQVASGKVALEQKGDRTARSPSHQCLHTGCPQNLGTLFLMNTCWLNKDTCANNWAMACHPPAQIGKLRPGSPGPRHAKLWIHFLSSSFPHSRWDTQRPLEGTPSFPYVLLSPKLSWGYSRKPVAESTGEPSELSWGPLCLHGAGLKQH